MNGSSFRYPDRRAAPPRKGPFIPHRMDGIDAWRFIAFVGVVLVHCAAISDIAYWGGAWGRFAVPVFFMTTGYFLPTESPPGRVIARFAGRLLPPFLFWLMAYLLAYREWPNSIRAWVLLVIQGGHGYHLWFLPSLGLCVTAAVLVRRYVPAGFGPVAFCLYVAGLCIGSYSDLLGLTQTIWNPRDGLMFGFAFIYLGTLVRERGLKLDTMSALAAFLVLSALHMAEIGLVGATRPIYTDFYILTPLLALSAFLLAASLKSGGAFPAFLAMLGRLSLGMYAVHVFFVDLFTEYFHADGPIAWVLTVVAVVLLSILVTLAMAAIPSLRRFIS
jgi:surface polysaccharide O-acyltransferase-like enzyme